MPGHGEKLSRKQTLVIAALLSAPTLEAAASQTDVDERTIRRWMKLPAFAREYRDARRLVVEQAIAGLQRACGAAVAALVSVIEDDGAKNSDRIRAATTILEQAFRGIELLDLDSRLAALEGQDDEP